MESTTEMGEDAEAVARLVKRWRRVCCLVRTSGAWNEALLPVISSLLMP